MHQFVTFKVEDYLLGVEIGQVREVNRVLSGTPVQHARAHVMGLVNLRGQIVTLFDLGLRLGLGPRRLTSRTHNVVLKREDVGLVVDEIGEVMEVAVDDLEGPPANLGGLAREFVSQVAKLKDDLLVVLDVEKILALD
jgi:purine-binding chemotaxis protein CheW